MNKKLIKNYNQFVLNENDEYENEEIEDGEIEDGEIKDGEIEDEENIDIVDNKKGQKEEENLDYYDGKLKELANLLNIEPNYQKNYIEYEGKKIIFPSETEKYHVDNKKFATAEEVYEYLTK